MAIACLLPFFMFCSFHATSQGCKKPEFPIKGKYETETGFLRVGKSRMVFSNIVKTVQTSPNEVSVIFPELYFDEEELTIILDGDTSTVPFNTNKNFSRLKFKYKGWKYNYKVYYGCGLFDFMLKGRIGSLLILKKMD